MLQCNICKYIAILFAKILNVRPIENEKGRCKENYSALACKNNMSPDCECQGFFKNLSVRFILELKMIYNIGNTNKVRKVAVSNPPITTVAKGF